MTTTTSFGTLTDHATGLAIRPATAAEWRFSAAEVACGNDTGAWELEGRAVFTEGGPRAEVDDDDIRELEAEAGTAGDGDQVSLCREALDGDSAARLCCATVILDHRMQAA